MVQDGLKDGWTDTAPGAAGVQPGSVMRCFSMFSTSAEITVSISAIDWCETAAVAQSSPLCLLNLTSVLHCNVETNSAGVYSSHTSRKIMFVLWRLGGFTI